jgi:hypothetical protein
MRKHAKFSFYFFAKNSENQAKWIAFRFEMRNNETKKEAKRAHPTFSADNPLQWAATVLCTTKLLRAVLPLQI